MGTNYYARIIPTKKQKEELKKLIDDDDYKSILPKAQEIYGKVDWLEMDEENPYNGGYVHLGKKSFGWKFLWNMNWVVQRNGHTEKIEHDGYTTYKFIPEKSTIRKLFYDLTKESIRKFIYRDDVIVFDEYDDTIDKDEFWEITQKTTHFDRSKNKEVESFDGVTYAEEAKKNGQYHPYRCQYEIIPLLEEAGFVLKGEKSDFYSDGMRFSTCDNFS